MCARRCVISFSVFVVVGDGVVVAVSGGGGGALTIAAGNHNRSPPTFSSVYEGCVVACLSYTRYTSRSEKVYLERSLVLPTCAEDRLLYQVVVCRQ